MTVTVLGTGAIGTGIATSLLRSGFGVTVWNRTFDRSTPLAAQGATIATDAAASVAEADIVIAALFDATATRDVLKVVAPAMKADAIFVQTATVGVHGANGLAALAASHDVAFLDCPVLGTKARAEAGLLTLLVAGDSALYERVRGTLNAIAVTTLLVGTKPGEASKLKLVLNAFISTMGAAVGQSFALASALGLDQQLILDAFHGAAADSVFLQLKGRAIIEKMFDPQFSVDGVCKDTNLIHEAISHVVKSRGVVYDVVV